MCGGPKPTHHAWQSRTLPPHGNEECRYKGKDRNRSIHPTRKLEQFWRLHPVNLTSFRQEVTRLRTAPPKPLEENADGQDSDNRSQPMRHRTSPLRLISDRRADLQRGHLIAHAAEDLEAVAVEQEPLAGFGDGAGFVDD